MPHDTRDAVVDFLNYWSERTEIGLTRLVSWSGVGRSKFYEWKRRYGRVNEHNGSVPRDYWLEEHEKAAIISFWGDNQLEGYRRLSFMMLDRNIVAASPSTVYRVLLLAGLLKRWNSKESSKGKGFTQPLEPHEHWHVDISYLNICGTFYYLCCVLDGCSRYIVHWEIRETMKEQDVEIIIQRGREKYPDAFPRIISDNGPQFISREFREFVRISGMTHVRTSPFYPQSNGKIERFHKTIKHDCIRQKTPLSLEDARRQVSGFIERYNNERLHSAIGYIAPIDRLEGRHLAIFAERDRKLEAARELRRQKRSNERRGFLLHNKIDISAIDKLTQYQALSISS